VNPVANRQSEHAKKASSPTEEGKPPRHETDEYEDSKAKEEAQACAWEYIKIDQHTFGDNWGSLGLRALPVLTFFPSLILNSYANLQPLRMSGAYVFSNTHDIAISGGTFYTADTVSSVRRSSLQD
jgi:hypothetical protein